MTNTHVKARRGRWLIIVAAMLLAALGVLAFVLIGTGDSPERSPAASSTSAQTKGPAPAPVAAPDPEVIIDDTRSMPYTPVWNPPDDGDDFWQIVDAGEGYPEDGGTDYLLAHACRDRGCAGDQIRGLDPGETLSYRGDDYVVDTKLQIDKSQIGEQDIWEHEEGRLVVITCILDAETGEYRQNDVVVAHLDR